MSGVRLEYGIPNSETNEKALLSQGSTFLDQTCQPAKNASTISQNRSGACSNIQWRVSGGITVVGPGIWAASARSTAGRLPLVSAPPTSSVGVRIDSASPLA